MNFPQRLHREAVKFQLPEDFPHTKNRSRDPSLTPLNAGHLSEQPATKALPWTSSAVIYCPIKFMGPYADKLLRHLFAALFLQLFTHEKTGSNGPGSPFTSNTHEVEAIAG